jgi:phage terminase small subunit
MTKRVKAGTSRAQAAERRKLFIEAYVTNGGNATQAAITAGFSPKGANAVGSRLSADVNIQTEIEKRRATALVAAQEETGLTVAGTLRELHSLVHADLRGAFDKTTGALLPPHEWPDSVARAMASVKVVEMAGGMKIGGQDGVSHVPMYTKEVKLWDKNAAIEKAMKHLGLFERDNSQKPPAVLIHAPGAKTLTFEPLSGRRTADRTA